MTQPKRASLVIKSPSRTRIRLYQEHVGYVDKKFLQEFQQRCRIEHFNTWIKRQAYKELGLHIGSRDDLIQFQKILAERHYENIAEWIKECMRKEMYPAPPKND